MFWLWKVWVKPSQGVFLDGERQFTLPICCYCRSHFVCFQTQLRKFPQQQPVWTETHTSEGIQNVMIWEDLHYSLRSLANVCLCVCVWVCVGAAAEREATEGWKPHPYGETAPESPIFHTLLPPQHNHEIPHSPPNTHTHSWCIGKQV